MWWLKEEEESEVRHTLLCWAAREFDMGLSQDRESWREEGLMRMKKVMDLVLCMSGF